MLAKSLKHSSRFLGALFIIVLLFSPSEGKANAKESAFLSQIRQLTFVGERAGEGYYHPSGQQMVFQSERETGNPFYQIYTLDLKKGNTQKISPGLGKTTCSWFHPNEEKILFSSTHLDPRTQEKQQEEFDLRSTGKNRRYQWDYDPYFDIFESSLADKNTPLKNLTQSWGYDAEASYSPDGKKIVFASNRHGFKENLSPKEQEQLNKDPSYFMDLYTMNADGSAVNRLTDAEGYDGGPFYSFDGQKICWRRFTPDGTSAEIYVMNADGSEQKKITHLKAISWAPFFHPSGDYLIFSTNLHGFSNFELYLVDSQGKSKPVRITYTEGFDSLPVFSPDGKTLSFTSKRNGKSPQIYLANWNDEEARKALGLFSKKPKIGQAKPSISTQDLKRFRKPLEYLASEKLEGRFTGSEGERLAGEYLANKLEDYGFKPAGDRGSYFQEFEFTAGLSLGEKNHFHLTSSETGQTQNLNLIKDWQPLPFSESALFPETSIVFAGYGIVAPKEGDFPSYDSYVHLDVQDKWVMVFRYVPEKITADYRQHLMRFASLRYKAMVARDRGAKGIIMVSGPNSKVKNQLVPLFFDATLSGTSIGAVSITDNVAQQMLSKSEKNLKTLQTQLDTGKSVMGFELKDTTIGVQTEVLKEKKKGRNIVGFLPTGLFAKKHSIAIGAHYDHLGKGFRSDSLAREDERDGIHYGADDNASGVVGILEVARKISQGKKTGQFKMKKNLLVIFWSGEEIGTLGSLHFVKNYKKNSPSEDPIYPSIAAYINMDMVGRLRDSLILFGIGSSSEWLNLIEKHNAPIGLPLTTNQDSYLPTDATHFYLKGVPILHAFTGAHEDYHTPRDTADQINYEGIEKITELITSLTGDLLSHEEIPNYLEMKKPDKMEQRAFLRAYLGTIPDYSQSDLKGVKLAGVAKGGPADQAGLRSGDLIIELGGKKIDNIYDYTYAIEALEIGKTVSITIQRKEQNFQKKVTPTSRE